MTANDIKDMEAFQSSPEGSVYHAKYRLQNAIDDLRQADPDLILEYRDDLAASLLDLGTILNAVTIRQAPNGQPQHQHAGCG